VQAFTDQGVVINHKNFHNDLFSGGRRRMCDAGLAC